MKTKNERTKNEMNTRNIKYSLLVTKVNKE